MLIQAPRFPDDISYGSAGGPKYSTTIIKSLSGRETRNINWVMPRYEFDVSMGVRTLTELEALIEFFHVANGAAHSFRYKDWADFKTCSATDTPAGTDQPLGTGDGVTVSFQLIKTYSAGAYGKTRTITAPVAGAILIAGTGNSWTLDETTGIITFSAPPTNGDVLTWGGQFDVPCRFKTDSLPTTLEQYQQGSVSVKLVEVRP